MSNVTNIKSLYVLCNAGYAGDLIEIAREAGAKGATIINARGGGALREAIMGITVDSEREIILILAEEAMAMEIMLAIKSKMGYESPARSICFTLPVEQLIGIDLGQIE